MILVLIVKSDKIKKEGNIALIYLILYSVVRIIVESFRLDSVCYLFGVPVAIFVSVGIIVISTLVLIKRK